jgi:hypothetical protein
MGLFFVRKSRYISLRDERNRYRERYEQAEHKLIRAQCEVTALKRAIDTSRKAFDLAAPPVVVHTWTTA